MPQFDLDPRAVGERCIGLLMAAHQLGHSRPKETVRSYLHQEHMDSLEAQFVCDLFEMRTTELIAKYGEPQWGGPPPPPPSKPRELGFGRMRPPHERN